MRCNRIFWGLALFFCIAVSARAGFMLEPPMVILKTNMGEQMAWIDVVSTKATPVAVELSVLEREVDINGEAVMKMEGGTVARDFIVYPAQIILRPGERQRVQVRYNGGRVTADRVYNLFSKEVPVPMGDTPDNVVAGVNTLVSYYSVIAMDTGKPGRLTFISSKMVEPGLVEVIVENKSNGRVNGENLVITLGGKQKIRDFTGKKNSIMPGQQRRFTFAYTRPITAREISFGTR